MGVTLHIITCPGTPGEERDGGRFFGFASGFGKNFPQTG